MQGTMSSLVFYITMLAILATGHSLPMFGYSCLNTMTPPTNARGVNRLDSSDAPLFRLEIVSSSAANVSGEASLIYRVQIVAEDEQFREAKISIESKGSCNSGSVIFDPHDYFEARQNSHSCPRMLLTNGKLPMDNLPSLSWRPPACGCVKFRALVTNLEDVYYIDNDDVDNGPLSQTVCVHQKPTRDQYLSAVCHVRERYSAPEIISRPSFLQRHQLEAAKMDTHGLEMSLELRRSDNRLCCSKSSLEAKLACFDDSRRRRVDRFCEDGYPDIPFTSFRVTHMRDRERKCCFLLGEYRYTCFAEKSELIPGPSATLLDFSQDETDPVNDLAEFATVKDADVVKSISTITFGERGNKDNKNDGDDDDDADDTVDDKEKAEENKEKVGHRSSKLTKGKKSVDVTDVKTSLGISRSQSTITNASHSMERHGSAEGAKITRKKETDHENPLLTSSERRKNGGGSREITRRNSDEVGGSRRKASREYVPDVRQTSSREYTPEGRRASGEIADQKKESTGKNKPGTGTWIPRYEENYSRGTGLSGERALSSAERRKWASTSTQRKDDGLEAIDEPDFEDQGGKSVGMTLNKITKKRDRLELRRRCCEAGAVAGRPVYGFYVPVSKECEHSMHKFTRSEVIKSGVRACQAQFLQCCIEQAVSGPAVTSSEFRDNQFLYVNNVRKLGSLESMPYLERNGHDQSAGDLYREKLTRDAPGRETPEAYELESERRFQSMREIDEIPQNIIDDDDYNGPRRFDEADNDQSNEFDILDRKDDPENQLTPKAKEDDKIMYDKDADERAESQPEGSSENKKQKIGPENKMAKQKKKEAKKDQLNRESAPVESLETPETEKKRSRDDSLLAKTSGGMSRRSQNSREFGGRSTGGRSRRFQNSREVEGQSKGGRSRRFQNSREVEGQSKGGRSSSRESRYLAPVKGPSGMRPPERYQYAPTYYGSKGTYKHVPSGKIGTEDSQEMAAAHARKFKATLDSKEMVDAYKKEIDEEEDMVDDDPNRRSNKKRNYKSQRWFH